MSRDSSAHRGAPFAQATDRSTPFGVALDARAWSAVGRVTTAAFERVQEAITRISLEAASGKRDVGLFRVDLDAEFVALIEVQRSPRNLVVVRDLLRVIADEPGRSDAE